MNFDDTRNRAVEKQRAVDLLAKDGALETICNHVIKGGTVVQLCDEWRIPYTEAVNFLYDPMHPQRKPTYEHALEMRGEVIIERILHELRRISVIDIRQAFTDSGMLKAVRDIPQDVASVISRLEVTELYEGRGEDRQQVGVLKRLWFTDKLKAIELLMRKHRLLFADVKIEGTLSLEELVAKSTEPGGEGGPDAPGSG